MISLLELVEDIILKVYDRRAAVPDPARFVIGDRGFDRWYATRPPTPTVGSSSYPARVLLRPVDGSLRLAIYLPDALITCLERHNPMGALHDDNVDAFLCFVEELDHFLLVVERWRQGMEFSLLELELHANLTKYFVARHFLRKQRGLGGAEMAWLSYHLFHRGDFDESDPEARNRYRDARRFAYHYLTHLMALAPTDRLAELRRWSRTGPQAKLARIRAVAG